MANGGSTRALLTLCKRRRRRSVSLVRWLSVIEVAAGRIILLLLLSGSYRSSRARHHIALVLENKRLLNTSIRDSW